MEEKFELSNEQKNEIINASVLKTMKQMRILMIVGWCFLSSLFISSFDISLNFMALIDTISYIGVYIIMIASSIIGIQLIRKQRIGHGVCIIIFGFLSFGIWPFVIVTREQNKVEHNEFDVSSKIFKASLLKNYNIAKILLIVGLVTYLFYIGIWLIFIAVFIIAVQDFRRDKLAHGVCITIFGWMTFGIWPLVYVIKQGSKIKNELLVESLQMDVETDSHIVTQKTEESGDEVKVASMYEVVQDEGNLASIIEDNSKEVIVEEMKIEKIIEDHEEPIIIEEKISNTVDQQFNTFKNDNNQINKEASKKLTTGKAVGMAVGLVAVSLICIVTLSVTLTKTSASEYIVYEPIEVTASYTVPEVPAIPAVYSEAQSYTYYFDTVGAQDIIICGEDIPVGDYTLKVNNDSWTFMAYIQNKGDGEYDGTPVSNGQEFSCSEGEQLRYGNDSGSITLKSEKKLVEAAVDAVPAYDVNTKMTTTFNEDGSVNEITCTEDESEVDCTTLPTYDKLTASTKEKQDSKSNQVQVTETMEDKVFYTTCTSTYVEEIECEETVTYGELIETLD